MDRNESSGRQAVLTQYGKTTFAHSLFWQSLSKPRELVKEAVGIAERNKDDLFFVRMREGTAQAALASTKEGYAAGQVSFAAALAEGVATQGLVHNGSDLPTHSWMGVFRLDESLDRYAFVAVRENAIMPIGDFVGTFQEAVDKLEEYYGVGGWVAILGSPEVAEVNHYHVFIETSYVNLLPATKKRVVKFPKETILRPTRFKVDRKQLILGSTCAVLIVGGLFGFYAWKEAKEEAEREAARAILQSQMNDQQAPPAPLPHPWATEPLPLDFAEACEAGMVILRPGGWKQSKFVCSNTAINYEFSRERSVVSALLSVLPDAKVDLSGEKATLNRPLKFVEFHDEEIKAVSPSTLHLQDVMQRLGVKVVLNEETPPPPKPPLPGEKVTPQALPDWRTFRLEIGPTRLPPTALAELIAIPGVRIKQIVKHESNWSIVGALYVR